MSDREDGKEKLFRVLDQRYSILIRKACLCRQIFLSLTIGRGEYWVSFWAGLGLPFCLSSYWLGTFTALQGRGQLAYSLSDEYVNTFCPMEETLHFWP